MIIQPHKENIQRAIQTLKKGELVGLPTETVYGLSADATQDKAVAKIFERKKRPTFNPLIVHAATKETFKEYVLWNEQAEKLAQAFWPGPLTLVLSRRSSSPLSLLVSAGLDSVAIRIPDHPIALEVLRTFGKPLAAPSANPSGHLSPTQANHIEQVFPDVLILEGGRTRVGIESTILDLTGTSPVILRPGGLAREELELTLGPITCSSEGKIKAPGMMKSHYAPKLPLRLNVEMPLENEAYLAFGPTPLKGEAVLTLSETQDLTEASANLFWMLRELDKPSFDRIAVAPIPLKGLGLALNDRLLRAAAPRVL